ncbi:Ig-like domain-containing protein [Mucilaginibacter sp. BT774]|uniref:Ig-like domain-containing protein n=1 Tax=Mucilaginibacter sp. BT774 TaxID=3062276 RepID=UPI00267486BE|nr:Ig-like domain-containing protein [Mucilaginibacter sp. BT774]MDO3625988.1 Ig-like domain-containing protein [Mucilaginibacter sp. BT774]
MKSILTITIIVVATIFFSCSKKQDNNVQPALGAISISGTHEADTIKGVLSAQIAVSGSVQPTKIEVYANDSLLTTVTKVPYNVQWNTFGVNNGNYKLKAIAYDNSGKQTQTTLNVVVHNVLVTLLIDPHINSIYSSVMYIVTDSAGTVLNSIKYNGTDKYIYVTTTHPDPKSRCSVFEVKNYSLVGQTYITAYMNIPKGSVWNLRGVTENLDPKISNAKINLANIPSFSRLTTSSDLYGFTYTNTADIRNVTNFLFSRTGKQYVQYIDNSGNGHYHFYDVDTVNKNNVIDLAANIFQSSITKTITANGATSISVYLNGKSDKSYDDYYLLDSYSVNGPGLSYYYPDGTYITNYTSLVSFTQNGWNYSNVYLDLPPETIAPFGTIATITSSSLSQFSFTTQGTLDYYSANFYSASNNAQLSIYSPSAYKSIQFPDILKLTNLSGAPLSNFKLTAFSMYKTPGFDESKLFYYTNEYPGIVMPSQSATIRF